MSTQLKFVEMYQVKDVSPLAHDFEAGQIYLKKFPQLGIYGDQNYIWFYKDRIGKAFYEEGEMRKEGESVFCYFSDPEKVKKYLSSVDQVIRDIAEFVDKTELLDVSSLSFEGVKEFEFRLNDLDETAFTYYCLSQPQALALFEEAVKKALLERVSAVKVNDYLGTLTLSEKLTLVAEEELDWLVLLSEFQNKKVTVTNTNLEDLKNNYPEEYQKLENHFLRYKLNTLGDGNWKPNIDVFFNNLKNDIERDSDEIDKRVEEIRSYTAKTLKDKENLIKELNLPEEVVNQAKLLSEIGYARFRLRVEGWVPLIFAGIPITEELAKRMDLPIDALQSCSKEEFLSLFTDNPKVTKEEMLKRIENYDYLFWIDNGELKILYGEDGVKKFKELVPEDDSEIVKELKGNTAMKGKVAGKVCLYNWGDDLEEKMKVIEKNPILVAGQTRPQMMPLIRKASGIITDEGGVISHAAIVARELQIPCVIGTKKATKVLKTGDMVELDADSSVVRILE